MKKCNNKFYFGQDWVGLVDKEICGAVSTFFSSFKDDIDSLKDFEDEHVTVLGLNVCVVFGLPYVIVRPSHIANGLGLKCWDVWIFVWACGDVDKETDVCSVFCSMLVLLIFLFDIDLNEECFELVVNEAAEREDDGIDKDWGEVFCFRCGDLDGVKFWSHRSLGVVEW